MLKNLVMLALCAGLCACAIFPDKKPVTQMTDQEFEANFVCPHALSTEGQAKSFNDLFEFAAARHPDWTTKQIADFRARLVERKQCLLGVQRPLG